MNKHLQLRRVCEGAIFLAMAQILSYLRLYRFPYGGSVDLSMLPLVVFAVRWGVVPGLAVGFIHGVLQYVIGNGISISWASLLGDYVIAYSTLFLAGFFKGRKASAVKGGLAFCAGRLLVHWVVGATVWKEYMPETFFGMTMTSPWFYSILYNGTYMVANAAVLTVTAAILCRFLEKYMMAEDLKPGR